MVRLVKLLLVLSMLASLSLVGARPALADITLSYNDYVPKGSAEQVADYRFSIGHCGRSYVVHMWLRAKEITSSSMYVMRVRVAIASYETPVISSSLGVYSSSGRWQYPGGSFYGWWLPAWSGENYVYTVNRRFSYNAGGGVVFWKITRAIPANGTDFGFCDVQTQLTVRPA